MKLPRAVTPDFDYSTKSHNQQRFILTYLSIGLTLWKHLQIEFEPIIEILFPGLCLLKGIVRCLFALAGHVYHTTYVRHFPRASLPVFPNQIATFLFRLGYRLRTVLIFATESICELCD
jgi:hypothetical protein